VFWRGIAVQRAAQHEARQVGGVVASAAQEPFSARVLLPPPPLPSQFFRRVARAEPAFLSCSRPSHLLEFSDHEGDIFPLQRSEHSIASSHYREARARHSARLKSLPARSLTYMPRLFINRVKRRPMFIVEAARPCGTMPRAFAPCRCLFTRGEGMNSRRYAHSDRIALSPRRRQRSGLAGSARRCRRAPRRARPAYRPEEVPGILRQRGRVWCYVMSVILAPVPHAVAVAVRNRG